MLQLESFDRPGLGHAFSNRSGGVSSGAFASLNVSFGVGDGRDAVHENRARLKRALGFKTMVSARQVHGNKVLVIDRDQDQDLEVDGYDALITDRPIALLIQQADCQAVILHDPVKQVVGAAHVGWRGSVLGSIGATVRAMADNFASDPADLRAAISPSLGPCCAEFVNYRRELPEWLHDFQVQPNYFDFWAISRAQLQGAGLLPVNINTAGICTCCSSDHFSYRRSRVTGRGATVIGLLSR
ncbi:MAG: laccase domain-containing protein [Desulfobulbaceae bacterium]|nr:laccase domain-containing protein [Desulfobulbaceae bacterium]